MAKLCVVSSPPPFGDICLGQPPSVFETLISMSNQHSGPTSPKTCGQATGICTDEKNTFSLFLVTCWIVPAQNLKPHDLQSAQGLLCHGVLTLILLVYAKATLGSSHHHLMQPSPAPMSLVAH